MIPTTRTPFNGGDTQSPSGRPLSVPGGDAPPDNKPVAGDRTPPEDPRLAAFAAFLGAVDRSDVPGTLAATRHLRKIGFSVVVTSTGGGTR